MAKKASASVPELAAFNTAKKAVDDLAKDLKDAAAALRRQGASATSADDFKKLVAAIDAMKKLRERVATAAEDLNSARDAARTALEAYIADLKAQQAQQQAQQAAPSALPPGVFPDSIAGSKMKVVSDEIGGTTGAKLVEIDGRRYILKRNRTAAGVYRDGQPSPEHVRNEAAADQAYRRAGIRVPDCRIYEEGGVTYKLSEFIPDGQSLGSYLAKATPAQREAALDQLAQGYPLDALFGNRDAYGTEKFADGTGKFDNILVDKDGNVWRIDNGSAFGFRARGLKKDDAAWKDREWPDEWRTLRQYNQALFKDLDAHAIFTNFNRLDIDAALQGLPDETRKAMEKPLAEMRELGARCTEFDRGKYQPAHTSAVLEASYDLCKDGLRELSPKQVFGDYPQGDAAFGMLRVRNGGKNQIQADDTPAATIINAAISIGHHINTGDFTPNAGAIDAALKLKPQLQAASAWDKNAQTLLDAIAKIEESQKAGFKTAIPHVNQVGVFLTDPSTQTSGRTFWDSVETVAASTGVDATIAPQFFRAQGGGSGSLGSLKLKVIELEAMGADLSDVSSVRGIWVRPGLEKMIKHYRSHPAEFERDKKSYALFKAATQIVLENTDFETRDLATRTVRLLRTSEKDTLGLKPGDIGEYADEGAHESFGTLHSVKVYCDHAYIRDVPFSRISSIYFTTTPVDPHHLYLGDDENETGANVIGLPAFYVGNVRNSNNITGSSISSGTRIRDFDKAISAAEAKTGKSLQDYQ